MINKDGSILINEWDKGIGQSPYVGFEEIRGLDIQNKKGSVYPLKKLLKQDLPLVSGPPHIATPLKITRNQGSNNGVELYAITDGNALISLSGSTWGHISTFTETGIYLGIAYWKNYIFVVTSATGTSYLNCYNLNTGAINAGSFPLTLSQDLGTTLAPMIVGTDDILYIGDGRYLASLEELSTFDAATAGTYSFNSAALDLPQHYTITAIEELGKNLLLGTSGYGKGFIFPWDRVSASYDLPILLDESGIKQMITHNGLCYVHAGTRGQWYITDGVSVKEFAKLPEHLINLLPTSSLSPYPSAIAFFNNKIMFAPQNFNAGALNAVWGLNPATGAITIEYVTSEAITSSSLAIGCLFAYNNKLYVGWESSVIGSTDAGIDMTDTNVNSEYTMYAITPLYQVGTATNAKLFSKIEIMLASNLSDTNGIKVQYRKVLGGSWTDIVTFDYTTYGAVNSLVYNFGATAELIQFKILFKDAASSPELLYVSIS